MLKPRAQAREGMKTPQPSLFVAARTNDLAQLSAALAEGKRLDDADVEDGFTPLHTAAYNGSMEFLRLALQDPTANPWLRDKAGWLAIDHADARRDLVIS